MQYLGLERGIKSFFGGKLFKAFYQDLLRRHQAEAAVRAELKLEHHVIVVPHRRAVGGQRRLPVESPSAPEHLQDGAVVAPCAVASGAVAEVRVPLRAVAAERAGADGPEVGELVLKAVAGVDVAAAASADSGALGRVLNKEKVVFLPQPKLIISSKISDIFFNVGIVLSCTQIGMKLRSWCNTYKHLNL